ncbi:MAG: hypothetical protein ACO21J_07200 [Anaerohalosphaeraceae bacterium]
MSEFATIDSHAKQQCPPRAPSSCPTVTVRPSHTRCPSVRATQVFVVCGSNRSIGALRGQRPLGLLRL